MRLARFSYLFLWMLAIPGFVLAQKPVYRNFSVNEGLASTECYSVIQDRAGYMWFGTDAGVCRFDGYHFTTFTTENGLPDNTIFEIKEDWKGRIWFRSYNGGLSYFSGDSIYAIDANKKIRELTANSIIESIYIDKKDTIWLVTEHGNGLIKVNPGWGEKNTAIVSLPFSAGRFLFSPDGFGLVHGSKGTTLISNFYLMNKGKVVDSLSGFNGSFISSKAVFSDSKIYLSIRGKLSVVDPWKKVSFVDCPGDAIISLYSDKEKNLWIGSKWHGLRVLPYGERDFTKSKQLLDSLSVSSVFEDQEGGIWMTTLEKGVYYLSSENFKLHQLTSSLKEKSYAVAAYGGRVWASSLTADLYEMFPDSSRKVARLGWAEQPMDNFINSIFPLDDGRFIVTGNYSVIYSPTGDQVPIFEKIGQHSFSGFFRKGIKGPDNKIQLLSNFFVYELNEKNGEVRVRKKIPSRPFSFAAEKNNHVWIGCMDGLWELIDTTMVYHGNDHPYLKFRIDDIKIDSKGTFWMATKSGGLIIRSASGITRLTVNDGLASNVCKNIYLDGDSLVWVGTNNGISCVSKKNGNWQIRNFSTRNGLPTNEINCITRNGNYVWAATNIGIVSFNVNRARSNRTPPPVYITRISINGKNEEIKPRELSHDQNFLVIDFVGLTYKDPGRTKYRYRLVGLDTNWKYTTATSVQFTTLPPGTYKFCVYAQNNDGIESPLPAVFSFTISPPFWKRWWFVGLLIITSSALIYLFIRFRVQQARSREMMNSRLAQVEMKALRAQMNPHFMFNAINSIQHFILKENTDNAHKYLSKFARLIRNVLDNSKHELISLDRDLDTLNLYIELEALRFSFGFSFSIEVDPKIDRHDTGIPPMLIQPFVENAIWHGLLHKEGKGHLKISVTSENDLLSIEIDDDGIGREKAATLKTSKVARHESMGMSVTRERLELLAQAHHVPVNIQIIDKKENNEPVGTRIIVRIPHLSLH